MERSRKRVRPPRTPKSRKDIRLEDRQIAYLEALQAIAPYGPPSFTSLVKQAVEEFINRQLANKDITQKVDAVLNTNRVVKLHQVQK